MKVVVVGDSHGNIANLKHALGFAKHINARVVIHTGDWDNLEAVKIVLDAGLDIYTVAGNADIDPRVVESLRLNANGFSKDILKIEINRRKIGLVHSFKVGGDWYKNCDIVFCGHRHSQDERMVDGIKVVRPGSLATEIAFAIYDVVTNEVEFISE